MSSGEEIGATSETLLATAILAVTTPSAETSSRLDICSYVSDEEFKIADILVVKV